MLPMGDAKGAALVLMVEILAAGLSGANFGYEASCFFSGEGPPPGVGQTIIALDPDFFSGESYFHRIEMLVSEILDQDGVRLPGSRKEALRRKAAREGLVLPVDLMDQLQRLS